MTDNALYAALAKAQARLKIIPQAACDEILRHCKFDQFDVDDPTALALTERHRAVDEGDARVPRRVLPEETRGA